MRIPSKSDSKIVEELNAFYNDIAKRYFDAIDRLSCYKEVEVMLPSLTISKHITFNTARFRTFLDEFAKNLGWESEEVSITTTNDLKRMHVQFNTKIKRHKLSLYLAVQYHTLLFYKCDPIVIKLKEELDKVSLELNALEEKVKEEENTIIEKEITRLGYDKLDDYQLLLLLYNNQEIASMLEEKSNEVKSRYSYNQLIDKKEELLRALNSYVIEVYTLEKRLIDYMQLMQGEEGLCIYFDLSIKSLDRFKDTNIIIDKMNEVKKAIEATETN